jgi:hypothetical protein
MAGVTATISVAAFRADWATHMPLRALCQRYTITRDQVVRLRDLWNLPLRNDRKLRWKPKRSEMRDPRPSEIKRLCAEIQATWDEAARERHRVTKTRHVTVLRFDVPADIRHEIEADDAQDA